MVVHAFVKGLVYYIRKVAKEVLHVGTIIFGILLQKGF